MSGTQTIWACVEFGKPLKKLNIPIPEPQGTQVLVRVTHCGICHTDIHLCEGHFDLGMGRKLLVKDRTSLPRAFGHEIVGTVAKLGPDADDVPIGASRIVYPWIGCRDCRRCAVDEENLCMNGHVIGVRFDGGYAQYILVPHSKYLIDHGTLDPAWACLLGCSGLTVLSAIQQLGKLHPEDPVLVVGAGGLGLSTIATLRALGHKKIVCADISTEKLKAALDAGASATVDSRAEDRLEATSKAAGEPIYAALDCVNNKQTAQFVMTALGKGGKWVVVGLLGGELNLPLGQMVFQAKSIIGNYVGNLRHLREVTKLAIDGKLKPIPVTKVPIDEVNNALKQLESGEVTGRIVLIH